MATPLINGRAYDFAQINILVGGVSLASATKISYETVQEKTNNFGAGVNVVSRGHGAKETTGSIELSMVDVEKLRDAVAGRDLLDVPAFDIVCVFGNDGANPTRTHTVKNCEFTNDGTDTSQGDMDIKFEFDFVASHVVRT